MVRSPYQHKRRKTIFNPINHTVESTDCHLGALSRFAVAVNLNPQLYTTFIGQSIMPHVLYYLDRVTRSHELRLITICLNNLRTLLAKDATELVVKKVYQFIEEGKLKDDKWTVLKVLQFLSSLNWDQVIFNALTARTEERCRKSWILLT